MKKVLDNLDSAYSKLQSHALEILKEFLAVEENEISIHELCDLGHRLYMLQLPVEAEQAYLKALHLGLKLKGVETKILSLIYSELSSVYEEMEDYDKAYEMLLKAIEIKKKFYSQDHIPLRLSQERLRKLEIFRQYKFDKELSNAIQKDIKAKTA